MSNDKIELSFLDLETTGLDVERHSITEVAIVRVAFEPGPNWRKSWTEVMRYETKVLPEHPYVEPFVAELNGYDQQAWMAEAKRLPTVLTEAYKMISDTIICGSNPDFDKRFLAAGFTALGWNFPQLRSHHMIDVPSMAAELLVLGKVKKIRQSTVSDVLGVPNAQAHRAMADVEQCMGLFLKVMESRCG
jgi:DNA polymerase III alpha subunit (gram-positive type)